MNYPFEHYITRELDSNRDLLVLGALVKAFETNPAERVSRERLEGVVSAASLHGGSEHIGSMIRCSILRIRKLLRPEYQITNKTQFGWKIERAEALVRSGLGEGLHFVRNPVMIMVGENP